MRLLVVALATAGTLLGLAHEARAQVERGVPCANQASRQVCAVCVRIREERSDGAGWCGANWVGPGGPRSPGRPGTCTQAYQNCLKINAPDGAVALDRCKTYRLECMQTGKFCTRRMCHPVAKR
jgi:hypothetical protein